MAEKPVDDNPRLTHNLYELQNNDEKEKLDLATIHIETKGRVVQKINFLGKTPFLSFLFIHLDLSNAMQSLFIFMARVIMVYLL